MCSRPTAPAAGIDTGLAPPTAAATASAFSAPDTNSHTSRERWIAGSVNGNSQWWGLGRILDVDHHPACLAHRGSVREQRVDVSFRPYAEEVNIEIRCGLARLGIRGKDLLVGQCGGGDVVAEFAVSGRHGVHVARRDVD